MYPSSIDDVFVKMNKSSLDVYRHEKKSYTSFTIYQGDSETMDYNYKAWYISKARVTVNIPLPIVDKNCLQTVRDYTFKIKLKKEVINAIKPLRNTNTTFSFVSYVDAQNTLPNLRFFKKIVCYSYATTPWLMDGRNVSNHSLMGMYLAKGPFHEYMKTQHDVFPQWEHHPLLKLAAKVFEHYGFVLKRQNIYSPQLPSSSSNLKYYDSKTYSQMSKYKYGHLLCI